MSWGNENPLRLTPLTWSVSPNARLASVTVIRTGRLHPVLKAAEIETAVMLGKGLLVARSVVAAEVPPPGAAFTTVICPLAKLKSVDVNATCSAVALTYVVGLGALFHWTIEAGTKPLPVKLIVAAAPAGTIVGEIEVIAGCGSVTVKFAEAGPPLRLGSRLTPDKRPR